MLVLSRKSGESIRIGDGIVVTITEIRGGRVKIGISAPESCSIRRAELEDWHQEPTAPAPLATNAPAPLATKLQAANGRRSAMRPVAAELGKEKENRQQSNRVRIAMETPITQYVAH